MAISIEELDSTVRAFYEGRGDQVRFCLCCFCSRFAFRRESLHKAHPACPPSRLFVWLLTSHPPPPAKSRSECPEPGTFSCLCSSALCLRKKIKLTMVLLAVQGRSRRMAHGRQNSFRCPVPADEMCVPSLRPRPLQRVPPPRTTRTAANTILALQISVSRSSTMLSSRDGRFSPATSARVSCSRHRRRAPHLTRRY